MANDLEKIIADTESLRLKQIELHNLKNTDKIFTVFYDETNNIRKLYVTDNGQLNVRELNNFVLGGVAYCGEYKAIDLKELRSELKLQDNVKELKIKNIAKGTFLEIINSEKMTSFLNFLRTIGVFIHYSHIDLMYWSIVDIIDSVMPDELIPHVFSLKAYLYEIIKYDLDNSLSTLGKYDYPNIPNEHIDGFLKEMIQIISVNKANLPKKNLDFLKSIFLKNHTELPFIQGYKPRELIDNFNAFYRQQVMMFKNSTHVFDEEPYIIDMFKNDSWINNARNGKFHFTTSEHESCVQLSDIVVGLIGKMYSYLRLSDHAKIEVDRKTLRQTGIENIKMLNGLLDKTEEISTGFIHHCASSIDIQKSKILFNV